MGPKALVYFQTLNPKTLNPTPLGFYRVKEAERIAAEALKALGSGRLGVLYLGFALRA